MNSYVELVKEYPIYSAMVQFAILGTLGDIFSKWVQQGKVHKPYKVSVILLKMLEWAIIAVTIKYAFTGFQGFIDSLIAHHLLPELSNFTRAFTVSVTMNLQYGLFLVIFHRFLDNLIAKQHNWKNIDKGMFSLIWFWIPAHTITFMLEKPFQIGLAALWSVVLGFILGYYNRENNLKS
ncbi:MAG: hypothetical protein HKP59_04420 [Lutibacter sp.]|uniref:hypothetical protein n=1 Tax=Lutibacter sp. TaxID=1925666 RepID=UPI0017BE5EDB|nr:hypothetical protein [Lutibacter sp.]MBT8316847.1 hypothetical protein [Lutibacter sp.]NNJ57707.1 hypothetical protein [Lutibacter sp.]